MYRVKISHNNDEDFIAKYTWLTENVGRGNYEYNWAEKFKFYVESAYMNEKIDNWRKENLNSQFISWGFDYIRKGNTIHTAYGFMTEDMMIDFILRCK